MRSLTDLRLPRSRMILIAVVGICLCVSLKIECDRSIRREAALSQFSHVGIINEEIVPPDWVTASAQTVNRILPESWALHPETWSVFERIQELQAPFSRKRQRAPGIIADELVDLGPLSAARVINFDRTDVNDGTLRQMAGFNRIEKLNLEETKTTDEGLLALPSGLRLEVLNLNNVRATDKGFTHLTGGNRLSVVAVDRMQITEQGLATLAGHPLVVLSANHTVLGDQTLQIINRQTIRTLLLGDVPITDAGLAAIGEMKDLVYLSIPMTKVTDRGLPALAGLKKLTTLGLGDTAITDAGLRHLAELQGVSTLDLESLSIDGSGLVHLARMPHLESLSLSRTRITDASLATLAQMSKLYDLDLSETPITDAGLHHLANCPALVELNLSETLVTDSGVDGLQKMTSRIKIKR